MSDFNSQNDEAAPVSDPSRQINYPFGSTLIQQGGVPVRADLLMRMETEMEPGEQLLWTGMPRRWQAPMSELIVLFVTGTPMIAMGVACVVLLRHSVFIGVLSFPIILLGLALLTIPFWEAQKNHNTIYALTNRRALILTAGRKLSVQSFHPEDVGAVRRTEFGDGTGHLVFGGRDNSDVERQSGVRKSGFYGIPGVRAVEKLARAVLKDHPRLEREDEA